MSLLPKKILVALALAAVVFSAAMVSLPFLNGVKKGNLSLRSSNRSSISSPKKIELKKFASAEEFNKYLSESRENVGMGLGYALQGGTMSNELSRDFAVSAEALPASAGVNLGAATKSLGFASDSSVSGGYSLTNVQVVGLDEPDVVKTDGKNIYAQYNTRSNYYYYDYYGGRNGGGIEIVGASPANDLKNIAKIPASGEFLIKDNIVIVFEYQKIRAFDITDKNAPKEIWGLKYENYGTLVGARLAGGQLYIAVGQHIGYNPKPCPFNVFSNNAGVATSVACTDIYHPIQPVTSNNTYTISVIDPATGNSSKNVSFVGSYGSIFYMAPGAVYLSYANEIDEVKFMYNFLSVNNDFVPSEILGRLEKLLSYDLSNRAKTIEMQYIVEKWMAGLSQDDKLKFENEMENRLGKYMDEHLRDLTSLSIVKVNINDFNIEGIGLVPGTALNQFSFDEYGDTLRAAVTMGGGPWGSSERSVSDVYVLDKTMNIVGSVKDLGKGERIYAVRFIGDRGYVVTFRQTDPFYVLSFADPKNPKLEGELKIPGFSSYLEPLKEHLVLGIGRENGKVKLSLFDVSDPKNPIEKSKYELNEYWSEALNNHHAFLKHEARQLFFLPGSAGGYIFSYAGDALAMTKAVSGTGIKRALYIGDAMYLVSSDQITSWDMSTWNKLDEVSIGEPAPTSTIIPPIIRAPSVINGGTQSPVLFEAVGVSNDSKRMSDLKQLQTALELYYTDQNNYPAGNNAILGSEKFACLNESGFAASGCKDPYMGRVPTDPLKGQSYTYTVSKDKTSYTVNAKLEGAVNGLKGGIKLTPFGISN